MNKLIIVLSLISVPLAAMDNDGFKLDPAVLEFRAQYATQQLRRCFANPTRKRNQTFEQLKEEVQMLIQAGGDINDTPCVLDKSNLEHAIRRLDLDLCELALSNGANIDSDTGRSIFMKLADALKEHKDTWNNFHSEPGMPRMTFNGNPRVEVGFLLIKHIVNRNMISQMKAIRTLILCLTRIGRLDYRMGDFVRRSRTLLMPYCLFNAITNCKEKLLEGLTKSYNGEIAYNIYPCYLLDPTNIDETIQNVIRRNEVDKIIKKALSKNDQ